MRRFTEFGGTIYERPVEDLAFAVARFIQMGGSFVNYYMVSLLPASWLCWQLSFCAKLIFNYDMIWQYHGGTNFGRTAGGPFITTSYDYDAPIDEYGDHLGPF